MKTSENLGLNIPDYNEFADIDALAENFKKLDECAKFLPKKIQLDYWTDGLVIQIGTIVIGRVKVSSDDGVARLSGLPSPTQNTNFTAVSTEQEKVYIQEFQAGETNFLMHVPYGSIAVITFMYETHE